MFSRGEWFIPEKCKARRAKYKQVWENGTLFDRVQISIFENKLFFLDRQICQFFDASNAVRCSMWFFHSIELIRPYNFLNGYFIVHTIFFLIISSKVFLSSYA